MIRVTVIGGAGRMAGEVASLVANAADMELAGIVERKAHPAIGTQLYGAEVSDDARAMITQTNVFVDFTSPDGLMETLNILQGSTVPLISGTTGLSSKQFARLQESAADRAVLWAPNMSLGVNLLFKLAAQMTKALPDYDVEILEMHHRHKRDAPSGTAQKLAEIVRENREIGKTIYGREGHTGERAPDEMAVLALRAGDVAGEHTLYFATEGERLELTHRASSRLAFAKGTLKAIRFIAHKPKGLYQFSDIMEEK